MRASEEEEPPREGRADPVAIGITLVVGVVSTLVLLFALFALAVTSNSDSRAPLSDVVLLPALTACVVGWFAFVSALGDRSVATGLSVFVALAADAAAVWLIFTG